MISKINAMNNTMKNFEVENRSNKLKIDNIFQTQKLEFSDYKIVEKRRKWVNHIKYNDEEFSFKVIPEMQKNKIQNLIIILKELHNFQNIIKFYGLTTKSGHTWYLVTEWAEYGNLREFY